MIYATEQQVVVTAGIVVIVAGLAFLLGIWWGHRRGREQAEEEARWAREQARAKDGPRLWTIRDRHLLMRALDKFNAPPEARHDAWLTHEEQALTLANEELLHEWHDHPPLKYGDEAVPGCPSCEARWETVLEPTAVLSPEDMSWTGEIQRMTAAFEEDMARIMGGTDQQLREITR